MSLVSFAASGTGGQTWDVTRGTQKTVLARRIRKAREERGLSQAELGIEVAKLLPKRSDDFRQTTVSKWETGEVRPGVPTLAAIAQVVQCSTDWLLGLSEFQNATQALAPGNWIIDETKEELAKQHKLPARESIGWPIPRRYRIADSTGYADAVNAVKEPRRKKDST